MLPSTTGISPLVDSVGGMIAQTAYRTHARMSKEHQRWLDVDDLVQEGLIVAHITETEEFEQGRGSKYSTYLHLPLQWNMKKRLAALTQHKRRALLVELDAPIEQADEDSTTRELPTPATQGEDADCVRSFITLCRAVRGIRQEQKGYWPGVPDPAVDVLIRGFVFGDITKANAEICQQIGVIARRLSIDPQKLCRFRQDENLRKKVLTALSETIIMGSGTEQSLRILECVSCRGLLTIDDIRNRRYFVSSMMCYKCHREQQKDPDSCFGKVKTKKREGYSKRDVECQIHCPDRKVCRQFTTKKEHHMSEEKTADLKGVDLEGVKSAKGKKTVKKLKGKGKVKGEKKNKVAKVKKEDPDGPAPAEFGGVWPFKANSQRRFFFNAMATKTGMKKSKFEAECKEGQQNSAAILKTLRRQSGKHGHTWKFDESGDFFRIYNVKHTGKKKASKDAE